MQGRAGTEPGCVEDTDGGEIALEEVWLENSFDLLCFSLYIKQKDGVYPKIVNSSFYSYVISTYFSLLHLNKIVFLFFRLNYT